MRRPALLLLSLFVSLPLAAARLPRTVIPAHYAISIAPDLGHETFSGDETIDVEVKSAVTAITLHSIDLKLHDVSVERGGKHFPAKVTSSKANETITLALTKPLPAGHASIHLAFAGSLDQQLRGLYLSTTPRRKYAVSQFEATDARRAFPCFDEPAMKATFDITLVIDDGDTAISNAAIISDTPAGSGKHAVKFATTQKMSSYLVAMLVGDFQCISGSADDVPIRVCSTPGMQDLGKFALAAAQASVSYYDRYYDIKYPFGKLDLIGIPDFEAGAMENAGAITFRESELLLDEKTATPLVQKQVAAVVAHEIAHQWFGDLVTMKWWNDIWLNEGFATFMEDKPVAAWRPEWRIDLDQPNATMASLTLDAQRTTRPIRTPADTPEEINQLFDGIAYGKTASVLRMIEAWIGEDAFRDGIRSYLKKYSWSNAAAEDFWGTLKGGSQLPLDKVLQSFVDQAGAPLLHVSESCEAGKHRVTISQERLREHGSAAPKNAATWTMPVCAHEAGGANSEPCRVIAQPSETFTTDSCDGPLFLSRRGTGYFIADYSDAERAALREHLAQLPPTERISLHDNEWLLVHTMRRQSGEYLKLLKAMPRTGDEALVSAMTGDIRFLDERLANSANRTAWQGFVHDALRGYTPVTWETPAGETPERRIVRSTILGTLAQAGGDRVVIGGALRVANQYLHDPSSVDPILAERALDLAAIYGDDALFDQVIDRLEKASSPEEASRYRMLVPLFRDPKVIPRAIAYIYGDHVRTQDLPSMAGALFMNPAARPLAWQAVKSHWSDLLKKVPTSLPRITGTLGEFCDAKSKADIESFFATHSTGGSERALHRSLEKIDSCIAFRKGQQASFDGELAKGKS